MREVFWPCHRTQAGPRAQFTIPAGPIGTWTYSMSAAHYLKDSVRCHTGMEQAVQMVAKWDGTTLGQLMRGMKTQQHWPTGLVDKLLEAVEIRNYLAHHFLREYFMAVQYEENSHDASTKLADLSVWLEELNEELDAHIESLGIVTTLDAETEALVESLRPQRWFGRRDIATRCTS